MGTRLLAMRRARRGPTTISSARRPLPLDAVESPIGRDSDTRGRPNIRGARPRGGAGRTRPREAVISRSAPDPWRAMSDAVVLPRDPSPHIRMSSTSRHRSKVCDIHGVPARGRPRIGRDPLRSLFAGDEVGSQCGRRRARRSLSVRFGPSRDSDAFAQSRQPFPLPLPLRCPCRSRAPRPHIRRWSFEDSGSRLGLERAAWQVVEPGTTRAARRPSRRRRG